MVAFAQFGQPGERRIDTLFEQLVIAHDRLVLFPQAVHLGRIEKIGKNEIDYRRGDENRQHHPHEPEKPLAHGQHEPLPEEVVKRVV